MGPDERKHKSAYFYALVAVAFWSTSASAFKLSLTHIDVLPLLVVASVTSTLALLVYLIAAGKLWRLRTFKRRDYIFSAALGFLNPFLYYVILFKAYNLLLAQEAQPLNFVWPLTLVLLSIPLLGQKIKPGSIVAILVSFAGVVVIGTRGHLRDFHFSNPTGVALALSTTVVWSLYWVLNTKDTRDGTVRLFVNFVFASVFTSILLLIRGPIAIPSTAGILGGIYIGLFEMGITFLAWLQALKTAKSTAHVVNLIYLVPFFSLLCIALVVGETIFPSTIIGLILIIAGIVLQKTLGS